jgi:hypothetical protein
MDVPQYTTRSPGRCTKKKSFPSEPRTPSQMLAQRLGRELVAAPEIVGCILRELPHIAFQPDRLIHCFRNSAERALCRALARAVKLGESWRVEIVGEPCRGK